MHSSSGAAVGGVRVRTQPDPPAGWDELVAADPASSPSHRSGLAEAFAAVRPGQTVEYLVAEDAIGLAGGVVLCASRVVGVEWLHALPMTLPGAPVARPSCRDAVDAALAEAFAARAGAASLAGGEWVCYRPGAPVAEAHLERLPGETRRHRAAVIDIRGGGARRWESDKRERYELRRAARAGVRYAEDPDALEACYALHLAQSRRWLGHRPLPLALLRRLLADPGRGRRPLARLFCAHGPRRLLGGLLVLDHEHETLAWWSGAHPEARGVAAFRSLVVWAIEWAAAAGRERFNLGGSAGLAGVASFKRALGAAEIEYPVRWLAPARTGSRARLVAALQRRVRRGRRRGDEA
jgi:hypothetical protein